MISDLEKMDLFIGGNWDPIEKIIRKEIAMEIEESRKPYLEYSKDKTSDDYNFYNGVCNGMFFATLIARGKDD
jgi:uncharacterized protein (DUF608 family)